MKQTLSALIIDDEPQVRGFLREILESEGWKITEAGSGEEALPLLDQKNWTLIFCDVMLGDSDGYTILREFVEKKSSAKFVLMTGFESGSGAMEATSSGAYDYLVKPFGVGDVLNLIGVVREQAEAKAAFEQTSSQQFDERFSSNIGLIGRSPKFVECLKMVGRIARTNLPVLIAGESGTGKEMVARAVHEKSLRAGKNFVAVNCGAIPVELIESELFGHNRGAFTGADRERTGLWEEAEGGTIFLDEITETPPQFQVKILRALQQSEIRRIGSNQTIKVDVRVIAATNRDIEEEVRRGNFREDLMYRLNAVTINLPPLRDRKEDIPVFVEHFARKAKTADRDEIKFSPDVLKILSAYDWKGNIRELENTVLRAVSLSDNVVYAEHLPARVLESVKNADSSFSEFETPVGEINGKDKEWLTLEDFELRYVKKVLEHTNGNKQAAARLLDIDRKTLSRMVERLTKTA